MLRSIKAIEQALALSASAFCVPFLTCMQNATMSQKNFQFKRALFTRLPTMVKTGIAQEKATLPTFAPELKIPGKSYVESEPGKKEVKDMMDKYEICETTRKILRHKGFVDFLPIQKALFDPIIKKKNVLGRDTTGSGKTLAFVIPMLESLRTEKLIPAKGRREPLVLIVVPTRELALQVFFLSLYPFLDSS